MKTKYFHVFALFITTTALLSGCAKPNSDIATENADLKARIQKLEQQLQAASNKPAPSPSQESESASIQRLKSQSEEAQKMAEAATDKVKSLTGQIETQKAKIDELTRQISAARQAREKAEKALKLYQDNATATSAIVHFEALQSILDPTADGTRYCRSYQATQKAVTKLADALPDSGVRRGILAVLARFTRINDVYETADQEMTARFNKAKAEYDKFVEFGGLGPNRYVIEMGKDKILEPAERENAATASRRDQQIAELEKDLDTGIKNLQALANGQNS